MVAVGVVLDEMLGAIGSGPSPRPGLRMGSDASGPWASMDCARCRGHQAVRVPDGTIAAAVAVLGDVLVGDGWVSLQDWSMERCAPVRWFCPGCLRIMVL